MPAAAPLRVHELREALRGSHIGAEIDVLEATSSTNDAVFERIFKGSAPSGLTIFAETQTAGRGQRGNSWESKSRQGLWFSILLRPRIDLAESPLLATWAIEAMRELMRDDFCLPAEAKAPNDLLLAGRKIAGVLVEMRAQPKAAHLAIVGIGLNVNQSLDDFPPALKERATSLALNLGAHLDRTALAVALLRRLQRCYRW